MSHRDTKGFEIRHLSEWKASLLSHYHKIISPHFYFGDSVGLHMVSKILRFMNSLTHKSRVSENLGELKNLRNSKTEKMALLLGNGPSLDKLNISRVEDAGVDVFVVNQFFDSKVAGNLKPHYYVLSDEKSMRPANMIKISEYASARSMTLFVPSTMTEMIRQYNPKVVGFNDEQKVFGRFSTDPTKPRSYISVTLYKALAIAQFMGYERIYILGLDNTEFFGYKVDSGNKISAAGNYASGACNQRSNPETEMTMLVSGMAGRMLSYARLFGDLAHFDQNRIINLSPISLVDVFTRDTNHPFVD